MFKRHLAAAVLAALAGSSHAATLLSEGFEDVAGLAAKGWVQANLSSPVGLPWGQGFVGPFSAQAGTDTSYAVANFESAAFGSGGIVDNWLITPTLAFGASNTLSFWTRTIFNPSIYPDRLEARLSLAGSSTDTAAFASLLVSVNPNLSQTGYPNQWTQYTASFTAAPGASGRIAFRYSVPSNFNADFIGLDTVTVSAVPEPATAVLLLLGLGALAGASRRTAPALTRSFTPQSPA